MSEPTIKVIMVPQIFQKPRWWRNPFRRWRYEKMAREYRENMKNPLYRYVVEKEERAFLFGDGNPTNQPKPPETR